MKKLKKFLCAMLAVVFAGGMFAGCGDNNSGNNNEQEKGEFNFHSHKLSDNLDYNESLFYVNTLDFSLADPAVIYISEGEEKGYYYAYGTSDDIEGHGFQTWRSKDLVNWEFKAIAFQPDGATTWATEHYWAPEVLYDNGIYYMFYSAMDTLFPASLQNDNWDYGKAMSIAVSSNPYGPFKVPEGQRDANNKLISSTRPVFDKLYTDYNSLTVQNTGEIYGRQNAIDIHPFIDPVSGKKYIFWSAFATDGGFSSANFGMEMKDWFTPKYETLTQVTRMNHLTVLDSDPNAGDSDDEGGVNEGPFIYYDSGKYYLTFSVYGFRNPNYQVRQAVSDSPLGPYTKLKIQEGGVIISTVDLSDKISSAGHHSFFNVGEELYIAYHTFKDRISVDGGRALAIDPVKFVTNAKDNKVMRAMGATYSMQPLPEMTSGYKNIAKSATITATNTAEGSDVEYLNDGLTKYQYFDNVKVYEANEGTSVITLSWDTFKTARAVMVYNSADYYTAFAQVNEIEMTYLSGNNGKTSVAKTGAVEFDWDWHLNDMLEMRPGGAVIAEFDELPVKEIKITIKSGEDETIEIPEIVVLGKDTAVNKVSGFKTYSYTNPAKVSPEIILTGENFSNRVGSAKGMYGFDVSNDKGENPYITNTWSYDQYIYFKNVFSTKFYAEVEIGVIEDKPYPFRDKMNDPAPKFGMVATAPKGSSTYPNNPITDATAFFYVDAVDYKGRDVSFTERNVANTNWNWDGGWPVAKPGVSYTNGQYIKMAMLRDGKQFYFYVNDVLVLQYDNFTGITDDALTAVGVRCFSSGLRVQNYMATTDNAIINQKLAAITT